MPKLVLDIETIGLPKDRFDEGQLEYLFRDAENIPDPAQREARRDQIQRFFSLWPLTGQIVCIAMTNIDSLRSKVLFIETVKTTSDSETTSIPPTPTPPSASDEYVPCSSEQELITKFWEFATHYDSVITFNGRGFDVPFLYLRSAVLNVRITRKDWLGYRFQFHPHCDLLEQLTFYGVSGREGASRRFNLDFYCKSFGIPSPKSHGVSGMDVGRLMAEGRARDVAEYCLGDVQATMQLYNVWKERLSGIS